MQKTEYFRFMDYFETRNQLEELLEKVREPFFLMENFDTQKLRDMEDILFWVRNLYENIGIDFEEVGITAEVLKTLDYAFVKMDGKYLKEAVNFFEFCDFMRSLEKVLKALKAKLDGMRDADGEARAAADAYKLECSASNAAGETLNYEEDFDQNGLIYWIGSKAENELWSNPAMDDVTPTWTPDVQVTYMMGPATSVHGDIRNVLHRVSKAPGGEPKYLRVVCGDGSSSPRARGPVETGWFTVGLGATREIVPTRYTLRHSDEEGGELRNWVLEGSCALGKYADWSVLCTHENDESLQGPASVASWDIPTAPEYAYRFFRVRSTGEDANGERSVSCAGFEIYGQMLRDEVDF